MRLVLTALDGLRPDMVSPAATPSLVTGCRAGGHGMVANTLFDAAVAPDRLLRTKLAADVAALARGGESPAPAPAPRRAARAGRALLRAGQQRHGGRGAAARSGRAQ